MKPSLLQPNHFEAGVRPSNSRLESPNRRFAGRRNRDDFPSHFGTSRRGAQQGAARTGLLLVICFLLGAGLSAAWFHRSAQKRAAGGPGATISGELSPSTKAFLKRLGSPVEIRFYSLLSATATSDSWSAFAERAETLLAEFVRHAGGKLKVTRYDGWSAANARSAAEDGMVAFNLESGEPSYLGLAVMRGDQRETIAQLNRDWEPALEFDLVRAIARVADRPSPVVRPADAAQWERAAEEVKRVLPNPTKVSLEEGRRALRDISLKEYKAALSEMEEEIQQAQQRLLKAQRENSEVAQQEALQALRMIQAKHSKRLDQIATESQARLDAWTQLKGQ